MTGVIAHEPDCPALCQMISCVHFYNLPHTKECGFGKNCPLGHACACRGEAWLRELVEAAALVNNYMDLRSSSMAQQLAVRLRDALQPFREEKKEGTCSAT